MGIIILTIIRRMNFKNNEKDIQKLLRTGTRLSQSKDPEKKGKKVATYHRGLYVISRLEGDTTHKIGMAHGEGGLFPRLKSYKLCWPYPKEYYVQFLVVCPSAQDAKKLEKEVLKNKRSLKHIEKNPEAQGRSSNEYRVTASREALKKALFDAMDRNRDTWEALIVFGENHWVIKHQDEKLLSGAARSSRRRGKKTGFDGEEIKTPSKGYFSQWDLERAILLSNREKATRERREKLFKKKKR